MIQRSCGSVQYAQHARAAIELASRTRKNIQRDAAAAGWDQIRSTTGSGNPLASARQLLKNLMHQPLPGLTQGGAGTINQELGFRPRLAEYARQSSSQSRFVVIEVAMVTGS